MSDHVFYALPSVSSPFSTIGQHNKPKKKHFTNKYNAWQQCNQMAQEERVRFPGRGLCCSSGARLLVAHFTVRLLFYLFVSRHKILMCILKRKQTWSLLPSNEPSLMNNRKTGLNNLFQHVQIHTTWYVHLSTVESPLVIQWYINV